MPPARIGIETWRLDDGGGLKSAAGDAARVRGGKDPGARIDELRVKNWRGVWERAGRRRRQGSPAPGRSRIVSSGAPVIRARYAGSHPGAGLSTVQAACDSTPYFSAARLSAFHRRCGRSGDGVAFSTRMLVVMRTCGAPKKIAGMCCRYIFCASTNACSRSMRSKVDGVLQHQLIDLALPVGRRRRCARDSTRARRPSSTRNRGSSPDRCRAPRCDRRWRRSSPFCRRAASASAESGVTSICTPIAFQRVGKKRRRARGRRHVAANQQREAQRPAGRIVEQSVAGAIAQPELGEHRARELRVRLPERKIGVEPRDVRRAHRTGHRIARAVEHLLAVLAAIDRGRDGEPKRLARQPGRSAFALPRRTAARRRGEPQRVGIEARAQLEQPRLAALLELLQRLEIFRANRARRRSPAAPPARPASSDDLIQIRKRRTVGRLAPVIRVAAEDARPDASRRRVFDERAEAGDRDGDRAARSPGANGEAKRISSVSGSSARTADRLAHGRHRGRTTWPHRLRSMAVPSAEVRPGRSFTVYIRLSGGRDPRLGEPGLELVGAAVDADERRAGQPFRPPARIGIGRAGQRSAARKRGFDERLLARRRPDCRGRRCLGAARRIRDAAPDVRRQPPDQEDGDPDDGRDRERGVDAGRRR